MSLHRRDVSQDVRELGDLLGAVLEDHATTDAFDAVEAARTSAIDYRDGDAADRSALERAIDTGDEAVDQVIARAFTAYFELVNLAEERERVRALRESEQGGTLSDSVRAAVDHLADAGADAEEVAAVLSDVRVVPTFTAHPTEARRKTVKGILRRTQNALGELDERALTDGETADLVARLDALVESLWTTRQVRERRPEPLDEARNVHRYLRNTLFDAVPEVYGELEDELADRYADPPAVPEVLSFRSWADSDRDGNPFVTPEVTDRTLARQRSLAVESYREALGDVTAVVSQDGSRIADDGIAESLAADLEAVPGVADLADRHPDEPFRQKVALMRERLARVEDVRPGGYDDSDEFLADLDDVESGLRANGCDRLADEYLVPLRRQAETFGFHLASLDLRDHREMHTGAIATALDREGVDYRGMSEDERVGFLTEAILQESPSSTSPPPTGSTTRRRCSTGSTGWASGTTSTARRRSTPTASA